MFQDHTTSLSFSGADAIEVGTKNGRLISAVVLPCHKDGAWQRLTDLEAGFKEIHRVPKWPFSSSHGMRLESRRGSAVLDPQSS